MPGTPFDFDGGDPYGGMPTEDYGAAMGRINERERPLTPEEERQRRQSELTRMQRFGQIFQPGITGNAGQSPMGMPANQQDPYSGMNGMNSPMPMNSMAGGMQMGQQAGQIGRGLYDLFKGNGG